MKKDISIDKSEKIVQVLDIEKIIRRQKNKFVKNVPKFFINFLKKSFHQDEINVILKKNNNKYGKDFIEGVINHLNISIKTFNENLLPKKGKFIFASNHSLGGVDFAVILNKICEKFSNVKIIANEMFLFVENTKEMFLPVSITNSNDKDKKDAIEEHLESDNSHLFIFPAGKVARKIKNKMDDGFWHRSFIRNAVEHKRDIIPIFIGGENSKKFYRLAKIRKFFRIKANLELFLLPGEVFKKRNVTIPIVYGEPISYTRFNDSKDHLEWAQEVKKTVYALGEKYLMKA